METVYLGSPSTRPPYAKFTLRLPRTPCEAKVGALSRPVSGMRDWDRAGWLARATRTTQHLVLGQLFTTVSEVAEFGGHAKLIG